MKNIIINISFFLVLITLGITQTKPDIKPLSFSKKIDLTNNSYNKKNIKTTFPNNNYISQIEIELLEKTNYRLEINIEELQSEEKLFIINENNNFNGPYTAIDKKNNTIVTDIIHGEKVIIELNSNKEIFDREIEINIINDIQPKNINTKRRYAQSREEPTIIVTGYWPPTNEMIRHFSQDNQLNPNGWQGQNWENRGYNIISFFPTFSPPNCSNCGQGNGIFEVDYQDTSEDFWPIFNDIEPIAVITFSRGYIDLSWEIEYNAYNRTNWYNDFTAPYLPTPNPPDQDENAYFLRNSNLPMENIIDAIDNLNLGLNPYIDINGDPGSYVSEFMAYHGTWYRDLNDFGENNCISAGHIHVGGNIDWDTARIATEETLRILINHLDQFTYIPGDVNQDDLIDILDLVLIMNNILGTSSLSQIQEYASDINQDSIINIQDIIIIINIILNNF